MDQFSSSYFNCGPNPPNYVTYDNHAATASNDRSGSTYAGFNISPQSYYGAHRASDPGCFTRPSVPAEDTLDLSPFDVLARNAVSNLHVQDVIKPAHNTPWVGPQQNRAQREAHRRPSLLRSPYAAKSEPLLRQDVYSEAADSGYVSHWPGSQSIANHYSMNTRELEQDYRPLPAALSPTGGADNQSTVSDGRLNGGVKQRKGKRPLTQCPQCGRQPRNLSDSKKHALTHTKPYRCTETDCTRKDGFATENDLQRHRKSVHNLLPTVGSPAGYICAACVPEVDTSPKFWPRRDNFKAHIKRKHPNHHEATLIEASRRRLRPGDDHVVQGDAQSVRNAMRSAQLSQGDPNETPYEHNGPPGLPNDSSVQSNHNGFFVPDSGIAMAMANEQALVGMQGHTVDQYGNTPMRSTSYTNRNADGYTLGPADTNCYGTDPGRLLSVLSEAADHLNYSETTSFMSAPRRPTSHASAYDQAGAGFQAPSPYGQYPCQHPGCTTVLTRESDLTRHTKHHEQPRGINGLPGCVPRYDMGNYDWRQYGTGSQWLR